MSNFSLNLHAVTGVRVGVVRTNSSPGDQVYAAREIVIETSEGDFELRLFSVYVSDDDERSLLDVKS